MGVLSKLFKSIFGSSEPTQRNHETMVSIQEKPNTTNEEAIKDPIPSETISSADNSTESVESITGIGPAYADRLGNAGVTTVSDLMTADTGELAEETGIAEKRIRGWINAQQNSD